MGRDKLIYWDVGNKPIARQKGTIYPNKNVTLSVETEKQIFIINNNTLEINVLTCAAPITIADNQYVMRINPILISVGS